jgi:hypothetical protein
VEELLSRISSRELTEWMAYDTLEPFGHAIDHRMMAQVVAAIYNVNRDPKKGKLLDADDFMLKRVEKIEQTEADIYARFRAWAKLHGNAGNTGR